MLETPSDQQLAGSTAILLGEFDDGGMLHSQSSRKGRVCLYNDVVLLAMLCNVGAGVERVDFDLVNSGLDP